MSEQNKIKQRMLCYHCGDECKDDSIRIDDKLFCCNGCKTVYEILDENRLCNYYAIDENPGISPEFILSSKFNYLDDNKTIDQLLDFNEGETSKVTFDIPQMHCSSCIWLLENLYKLNDGISRSQVDFLKKKLSVTFNNNKISLKELVQLLASIGYEPQILLDSTKEKDDDKRKKQLYYRIGIAGFSFGNIMLFSFPEYLSLDVKDEFFRNLFGYLNFILALPVFFYSAWEYFGSALKGLRKKVVNIDFPVSLGIIVLFARSSYEVLSSSGAGYFDSLAGLVFFLLLGKLFQEKTYDRLNFERSYKSYFPLSVIIKKNGKEKSIPVSNLSMGNRIVVRKNEIVPADSILLNGEGKIDYSFVTGESKPVDKVSGEIVYAGGRQLGGATELEVIKEVSQSYLTQLWNNEVFNNPGKSVETDFTKISNTVSKYFTAVILLIAIGAASFWLPADISTAVNVFTSVLIVACPCALALSTPFTLGNALRIFGRNKFYLKNSAAIENLSKINTIVFDKTGTLTKPGKSDVIFKGKVLSAFEQKLVKSLVRNSVHPLSRKIFDVFDVEEIFPVTKYSEETGLGISGVVFGRNVKLGSQNYMSNEQLSNLPEINNNGNDPVSTKVYLSIDDEILGFFELSNSYREGIINIINGLKHNYKLSVLSGDNEGEKANLLRFFNNEDQLRFNQSPMEKLEYIKYLQSKGKKVLMIGDGLNDAGALKQSDVGVAVSEETGAFSPASDAILDSDKLTLLPEFLKFSKESIIIIFISFTISFLYNVIGLGFAVQGLLSPIVAAILMPLSSISVVIFTTLSTNILARRRALLSRL